MRPRESRPMRKGNLQIWWKRSSGKASGSPLGRVRAARMGGRKERDKGTGKPALQGPAAHAFLRDPELLGSGPPASFSGQPHPPSTCV